MLDCVDDNVHDVCVIVLDCVDGNMFVFMLDFICFASFPSFQTMVAHITVPDGPAFTIWKASVERRMETLQFQVRQLQSTVTNLNERHKKLNGRSSAGWKFCRKCLHTLKKRRAEDRDWHNNRHPAAKDQWHDPPTSDSEAAAEAALIDELMIVAES